MPSPIKPEMESIQRQSGRTTKLVMLHALWLVEHPGVGLKVYDHHDSREANLEVFRRTLAVLDSLGLKYLHDEKDLWIVTVR